MYKTDLMNKIIKSEEAEKIINMISPIYGEAYAALWLFEVIGCELDEMLEWCESYRLQVVPQTATWSLPYWEMEYGIAPDEEWTLEQRRANLIATIRYRAPMNASVMAGMLSSILGLPVVIDEYAGKNKFAVNVIGYTQDRDSAIAFIEKAKPAHMIYDLNISDYEEATINSYYSIKTSCHETIDVTFV